MNLTPTEQTLIALVQASKEDPSTSLRAHFTHRQFYKHVRKQIHRQQRITALGRQLHEVQEILTKLAPHISEEQQHTLSSSIHRIEQKIVELIRKKE